MDTLRGASGSDPKTLHAFRAEREGARWWHRVTVSSGLLISSLVVAMLVLSGLLAYQARTSAQQAIFAAS